MSRIVLATTGTLGDLHPYLAVGVGLKQRGHHVLVATGESYRPRVEGAGLEFCTLAPDFAEAANPAMCRRIFDGNKGVNVAVREILVPGLEQGYIDLLAACEGADLLIAQTGVFMAPLVAEKLGLPWMSVFLAPSSVLSAYDPPLIPMMPWMRKLHVLGPWPHQLLVATFKLAAKGWLQRVHDIRKREQLSPSAECPMLEDMFSPYGTMAWFSEVMAKKQKDWPDPSWVTGFSLYEHTADGRFSSDRRMDPELEAFLAEGDAPIVFTLGSFAIQDAGDFFQQSLLAVRSLGRRAVFLVGDAETPRGMTGSDAVFVTRYAPHSALFRRAACVVHQGGMGTSAWGLHAGVPALIVPWGFDQPDNAFRLDKLGVARTIARRLYKAERVEAELRILLGEPRYAQRARAVGEQVRSEDGVGTICGLVGGVLREEPHTGR